MRLKTIITTMLLALAMLPAAAQKTKTVEAEYTYHAPENVTTAQAKQTALERAQIKALADEFGTIMSQITETRIGNANGESSSDFMMVSGSDVKGEWIETIGEPKYTINYDQGMLVVTVKVKGKAREISASAVDFDTKVLRNGTDDRYESTEFKHGDDLYLSFQTPKQGYLAVYLVDDDQNSFCLLPYQDQKDGIYPVQAGQRYLLFNREAAKPSERQLVDEYQLECNHSPEYNRIYVIFSPTEFTKASDQQSKGKSQLAGTAGLPRQLSYRDFQKWLTKQRGRDEKMNVRVIPITITK